MLPKLWLPCIMHKGCEFSYIVLATTFVRLLETTATYMLRTCIYSGRYREIRIVLDLRASPKRLVLFYNSFNHSCAIHDPTCHDDETEFCASLTDAFHLKCPTQCTQIIATHKKASVISMNM